MKSDTAPLMTPCSSTSGTAVTMPQVPSQRLTTRSLMTKPSPLMMDLNQPRSSTLTALRIGAEVQVNLPSAFTIAAPAY
jgi:hypothetical protein